MLVHVKFRRGLEADRLSILPKNGEPLYTTDTHRIFVGDGITPGGNPAKCDLGSIGGFPFNVSGTPNDGDTLVYNASTGEWEYGSGGGGGGCTTLNCLNDVNTSGAGANQVLGFDGSMWVPVSIGGGSPHDLDSHTDVNTTGVSTGDVLQWNGSTWVAGSGTSGGSETSFAMGVFFGSF